MMPLWTIGFVHTSTHRLQLLQSGFGGGVQAIPSPWNLWKAIIPTLLNHPLYVSYWGVQAYLTMCGAVWVVPCCGRWWGSVLCSPIILLITSAFGSPFFIHFRTWRTCLKVFAFLTIFENHTTSLVVIAFWKFSESQRIMGLWKEIQRTSSLVFIN
jgi:hypothetical protein